ncbi:hypothetical protein TSAR_013996, partial [Trichomalopsis sarcophagae]
KLEGIPTRPTLLGSLGHPEPEKPWDPAISKYLFFCRAVYIILWEFNMGKINENQPWFDFTYSVSEGVIEKCVSLGLEVAPICFLHIVCPNACKKLGLVRVPSKLQELNFSIGKCPTFRWMTHMKFHQHIWNHKKKNLAFKQYSCES